MSPFLGEFIGTMLLILLGDGVVAGVVLSKSKAHGAGWVVITFGWGLAVTMAIYAVGSISGAHINPAVTIGLAASGAFPWLDVPAFVAAQMLGAFTGAVLVWLHYLPHWSKTKDQTMKLAVFCTGPAVRSNWANLLSEIIGTFVLVAGVLFIGANKFTEGLNPIAVGALIVAIGMSLGGTTGYAINPARDLAPRLAHYLLPLRDKGDSDWGYAGIPVLGPIIGGLLGAFFYEATFQSNVHPMLWVVAGVAALVIFQAMRQESA
jgi:glycerol uptake facilitator protein